MNYLVGDIGNTFVKLSILNEKFKIIKSHNIETKKIFKANFKLNFFNKIAKKNINRKFI